MKKLVLLLLFLFLFVPLSFADDGGYTITDYHVDMKVDQQNNYDIMETIQVNFSEPRHGLYRFIPLKLYGYVHDIDVLAVTDENGLPIWHEDTLGSTLDIKFGDPNNTFMGPKTYTIHYKFYGGDDRSVKFDKVYWNLLGTDWDVPVEHFSFQVSMPKEFDASTLKVTYGPYGSVNALPIKINGTTITGEVRALKSHEAVTFRVDMPKGYFTNTKSPYKATDFLPLIVTAAGGIFASAFLRTKNAAQNQVVPVVSFQAPDELTPPEAAYIFAEEGLTNKEIVSIILHWASKGYLNIIEDGAKGNQLTFRKNVDSSVITKPWERALFQSLFSHGDGSTVRIKDLKEKFYQDLGFANKGVREEFTGEQEILQNSYQYLPKIIGVVLIGLASIFLGNQFSIITGLPSKVAMIGFGFVFLISFLILSAIKKSASVKGKSGIIPAVILVVVLGALLTGLFILMSSDRIEGGNIASLFDSWFLMILAAFVLVFILLWEVSGIKRYSDYGRSMLGKVRGFEQFIRLAKADELNALYEKNPSYFYDVLPFAYVFGLSDKWSHYIKDLAVPAPSWYEGSYDPMRFPILFSNNMTTASSVPAQSGGGGTGGFGGGGFSGGGGGGGGGGSW